MRVLSIRRGLYLLGENTMGWMRGLFIVGGLPHLGEGFHWSGESIID